MCTDWEIPNFQEVVFSEKKSNFCVVIPVINEGERIHKQLEKIFDLKIYEKADIIIADGDSTDGSLDNEYLKSKNITAKLIKKDTGKLSAQLRMGYSFALKQGYNGIVTVDGNNKDSMESIFEFIRLLEQGYDFIQGSRFVKGGNAVNTPFVRHLAVKLLHIPAISLIAGFKFTDTTNGFRGYSRNYLLHLAVKPFRAVFKKYELLAYLSVRASQLGLKVCETPVTRTYQKKGKVHTKISFLKGNFNLLKVLFKTAIGGFNPE